MDIEKVDLLRKMVDEASFGMYVLDTERKIVFWSMRVEEVTGFTSEEMIGRHCFNAGLDHIDMTGIHLCHDFCPMMATIFDGKSRERPVFLRNKAGKRVPVLVHTEPLFQGEKTLGAMEYFRVLPESEYSVLKER